MTTEARPGGAATRTGAHPLDNAVWHALSGPHANLAERVGQAARYPADVYAFAALADPADTAAWADLRELVGPRSVVRLKPADRVPEGWVVVGGGEGVQLVDTGLCVEHAPEAVLLGPADVPEILDLVARTRPGPFLERTIALGTYLGIRHQGRLIAMAGERSEMGVPPAEAGGGFGCPAGRRSAPSAPTRTTEAGAWPPASSARSPRASAPAARPRSCTRPRTTPRRSVSTSRSASPCAAARRSSGSTLRNGEHPARYGRCD